MSQGREFYAATIDEAVEKAAETLGIPKDQFKFDVLDEGSVGFLGIGARDARILVEPLEVSSEGMSEVEEARTLDTGEEFAPEFEDPEASRSDRFPADSAPEDLILDIDEFLTTLIEAMGLDATVDAFDAGDVIRADVATKETGLFIGQKGETIDAIQYLLNVTVYRNRPFVKRIVVDAEGYRQRRVEAIQGMAHRTARRVLRERRPLTLPPMSAAERRVVHLFLKEKEGVTTFSEGEEEARRVVIAPVQ